MSIEKDVKFLHGSDDQKHKEIQRQIREAILPFFPERADDMASTLCGALAEHPYVVVTNAVDLTVIWDSGQGIVILEFPKVGYIERASATRPYFH